MPFPKSTILAIAFLSAASTGCVAASDESRIVDEVMKDPPSAEEEAWTSEEYAPATCPSSAPFVIGAGCSGSYCDNVDIECTPPSDMTRDVVPVYSGYWAWTGWFSEEGAATGANKKVCPGNQWMTGIRCSGSYCDQMSIRCSDVFWASSGGTVIPGNCNWSDWYSEEDDYFWANYWSTTKSRFIRGVKCSGSYCDNLSFYVCSL